MFLCRRISYTDLQESCTLYGTKGVNTLCDAHAKHACPDRAQVKVVCSTTRAMCSGWGGCCFVNTELSFTLTVPLLSYIRSKDVQCIFSNHVIFPAIVGYVYLTVAFTERCVPLETSCQLRYIFFVVVVNLLYRVSVWWNCCQVTVCHEWFCTSSSPRGWALTVDHFIEDIRTAGELSLPSSAASKKTFSVHTSHPWRQASDFPFFFFE